MKKHVLLALLIATTPWTAFAQNPGELQKLFEAGQYQQIVELTQPEAPPEALYLAAQSHQKLGATNQALEIYRRLAQRPDGDPWRLIGRSGQLLLEDQVDAAAEAAHEAVSSGDIAEAHYQLGLVHAKRQEWRPAAAAFDRASDLDPSMAYAHYYGGLMHYRAKSPDRMANHFERFLKLAPDAPERPEVLQIMRTVRGR